MVTAVVGLPGGKASAQSAGTSAQSAGNGIHRPRRDPADAGSDRDEQLYGDWTISAMITAPVNVVAAVTAALVIRQITTWQEEDRRTLLIRRTPTAVPTCDASTNGPAPAVASNMAAGPHRPKRTLVHKYGLRGHVGPRHSLTRWTNPLACPIDPHAAHRTDGADAARADRSEVCHGRRRQRRRQKHRDTRDR